MVANGAEQLKLIIFSNISCIVFVNSGFSFSGTIMPVVRALEMSQEQGIAPIRGG